MTHFAARVQIKKLDQSLLSFINSQVGKSTAIDKGVALLARNSPDLFYLYFLLVWYGCDPKNLELRRDLLASLTAGLTAVGIATLTGRLIDRERPFARSDEVKTLLDHHPGHSFPSRHVAGSVGFATGLGTSQGSTSLLFGVTAAIVALSRTYTGVHWPSDLVGGAALGAAVGRVIHTRMSTRLAHLATRATLAG